MTVEESMHRYQKAPTVPPHVVFEEMVEVGKKYGYHLQYGASLTYWVGADQYIITVPEPKFLRG